MGITENLRNQHKEILDKAAQISKHLNIDKLSKDPSKVHRLLAELAGNLNFHLEKEDKFLYPALLRHPNKSISLKAKQFMYEMALTLDVFEKYLETWKDSEMVRQDPGKFINDTKKVFSALSKRIDSEDNGLYPLVDR